MASASKQISLTPEEYLTRERLAEFKSEYYNGQIHAMSGARRPHNLIAANLSRVLGNQLADRPCELYIADMRVRVETTGSYSYPDLVAVSGEPRFADGEFDTLLNPDLVIEILSPSTESWDRGGKFANFRRLGSLQDYVLVSQDKIHVEHFARQGNQWLLTEWDHLEDTLRLASIGCDVALREIYAKVRFSSGDVAPGA